MLLQNQHSIIKIDLPSKCELIAFYLCTFSYIPHSAFYPHSVPPFRSAFYPHSVLPFRSVPSFRSAFYPNTKCISAHARHMDQLVKDKFWEYDFKQNYTEYTLLLSRNTIYKILKKVLVHILILQPTPSLNSSALKLFFNRHATTMLLQLKIETQTFSALLDPKVHLIVDSCTDIVQNSGNFE